MNEINDIFNRDNIINSNFEAYVNSDLAKEEMFDKNTRFGAKAYLLPLILSFFICLILLVI